MRPAAVTWRSCIASSSAAWVFGGVRLISSASTICANTGPFTNRRERVPFCSSRNSVPVMSDGIRSGVNWMRLKLRSSTSASVLISSVLARPGTPVIRQCPPVNSAVSTRSITSSWPTMTLRISERIALAPLRDPFGQGVGWRRSRSSSPSVSCLALLARHRIDRVQCVSAYTISLIIMR